MNRLWRALTRNLLLKFSALVCAGVLWVYVDSFAPVERRVSASVALPQLKGLRCSFVDTGTFGASVTATVRGPSRTVRMIGKGDIVAFLDESALEFSRSFPSREPPSAATIELSPEQFTIRRVGGVEIVEIEPSVLWVTYERSAAGDRSRRGPQLPGGDDAIFVHKEEAEGD